MSDLKNQYNKTQQLSEGVYVIEDGNSSWGGEVNHNFELLNSILAKKTLTITQGDEVLGTFDNSQDVEIEIPEVSGGAKKVFTKKFPFVELHFTEPFLTDVLGYETVEQAVEWLPYRNSVKVFSIPFLKSGYLQKEIDNVFYKDINTIYKGEHNSSYYVGERSIFENNVDRDDYSKLEKEEDTGKIFYLVEKYRVLGDTSERVEEDIGSGKLTDWSVSEILDDSYGLLVEDKKDLEELINSSLGDVEYIIHVYAFRVSDDSFYIPSNPDLQDFWYSSEDNTSVEERIEQFNNVIQNIEGVVAHINFRVFDKSKIVPEYFNSTKTHVFRFISSKNKNSSGEYSTIFFYPNDNGMYHIKCNTNVKTNAYLVGASIETQESMNANVFVGSIDITDTINDDLEETFKEIYR